MGNSPQTPASAAVVDTFEVLKRSDNMALIYQEVFTVIMRLRANRQRFGDPEVFRGQIKNALKSAENEGTRRGYTVDDLNLGAFAVVAFLDESILNSQNPIFADWQRKPLQQDLFGIDIAGKVFFEHVEKLLRRADSAALADLLEVHQLCLLMGYRGLYSVTGNSGEIREIIRRLEEKIARIRGEAVPLAWQPPLQSLPPRRDRWTPLLKWCAVLCICLALLLFGFYKFSLRSAETSLSALAADISR